VNATPLPLATPRDLTTDQPVRWCPGCGDFSILAQLKHALATAGIPRSRLAVVSGYGCAGRLPYYLNTFGFHTLPGRAFAVAAGLKAARPDLSVWVVTGDGDALSAGTNHLMQAIRRNSEIKVLLFNNEILGLTKGQASPTSRPGTRSRTTPQGSVEAGLRPLCVALAAEATFVARTIDVDADHFTEVIRRAAVHRGTAFVEVYQNCNVFNDGAFGYATDTASKADATLLLEHGKPLLWGAGRDRGVRMSGLTPELVAVGSGAPLDDIQVHDERAPDPTLAWVLSRMAYPEYPECFGVFRAVERPTWEDVLRAPSPEPTPTLEALLLGDDAWELD